MTDYEKQNVEEFRKSGLLWFANMILHTFGWTLIAEKEDGVLSAFYPMRCSLRGFDNDANTEGYIKVSKFLKENADELLEEALEK